jgi:hypothetical protein
LTIIGFEKKIDGTKNLLVFDPMFHDPSDVTKLVGQDCSPKYPGDLLRAYRRNVGYLRRYKEFEILRYASRIFTVPETDTCSLTSKSVPEHRVTGA